MYKLFCAQRLHIGDTSWLSRTPGDLLALLDCVSIAYSMWLCPSSVVPLSVLRTNWADAFSKLQLLHAWAIHPDIFEFLNQNTFSNFFSLTWHPMGAKTSKTYSSFKSALNLFKVFLNFLLSGYHKSTVIDLLKFWGFFFSFSLTWDPMGANEL